jgi:predicted DNA-binding antitoxin AbrB/MazE fold protein
MGQVIEAVYEDGAFRPLESVDLREGQRVALVFEPVTKSRREAKELLRAWQSVYEGLSEGDIAEVEAMALDRSRFAPARENSDDAA